MNHQTAPHVRLINKSARGMGMLAITHHKQSETRHCKPLSDGWLGYYLEAEKQMLQIIEAASAINAIRLLQLKQTGPVFKANLLCRYQVGDFKGYEEQYRQELARGTAIVREQMELIDLAEALQAAKTA